MKLLRIHAYKVLPKLLVRKGYQPTGGEIPFSNELEVLLEESIRTAKFDSRIEVNFIFPEDNTRNNEIRDLIMSYCFGNKDQADDAAKKLALYLSNAMNRVKQDCLFILAVKEDGNIRQATLWSFPADTSFRFLDSTDQIDIEILEDVFSKTSNYRKAALFEGENLKGDFLSGRILDVQGGEVAKFWYEEFLQCNFALESGRGARYLANFIRETYEKVVSQEDKQIITNAILGLRNQHNVELSFNRIANNFLRGYPKSIFEKIVKRENLENSRFILDIEEFDKTAKFQMLTLHTGAIVYVPFNNFDDAVSITDEDQGKKFLRCEGFIEKESIRA